MQTSDNYMISGLYSCLIRSNIYLKLYLVIFEFALKQLGIR